MRYLISVDDTDNLESRGTGYRARQLAEELQSSRLARVEGITRHQLLLSPEIAYTSHNSAVCMVISAPNSALDDLAGFCRDYLARESAPGADAGLCLAAWEAIGAAIRGFGQRAKLQVLTQAEARQIALSASILLEEVSGAGSGIIGALAGAGLRAGGNDGRFLWLPGLRELRGAFTTIELRELAQIDKVCNLNGASVPSSVKIELGDWPRPILKDGQAILLVEEVEINGTITWRVLAKETIKQLSE